MVKDSWRERVVVLVVDVVSKHVISGDASSSHRCASGVTTGEGSGISENVAGIGFNFFENAEGTGDAYSSPPPSVPSNIPEPVDWANLIIHQDGKDYGDATAAVDEDKVYEAMGFWAADQSPLAASWSRAGGGRGGRQSEWAERYCHARRGEGNRWEGEGQGQSFGIPLVQVGTLACHASQGGKYIHFILVMLKTYMHHHCLVASWGCHFAGRCGLPLRFLSLQFR